MAAADSVIPVKVVVRVRPLSGKELHEGCESALRVVHGRPQIALLNSDKAFTYDFAFDTATPQPRIFQDAVAPLVTQLFKGYNATVLAYGQTGSGKTYTMGTSRSTISPSSDVHEGVIGRSVETIFNRIRELQLHYEFKVRVSFVELYKEQLCDLLTAKDNNVVDLREDPRLGTYIANLTEVPVDGIDATFENLVKGSSKRSTAATAMNSVSSRSHAIFTIGIEGCRREASASEVEGSMPDTIRSKFHLVDLAGSERAKKTQATGERYKEGVSINLGLLSLGNVIAALGEDGGPKGHISYRDSKLTRLLQDSLGGNSHTLMIACVSPADSNIEETLSTLRYADRARKIKNKPIVNRGDTKEELIRLRRENQDLKLQLMQGGGNGLSEVESKELLDLRETVSRLLKENREMVTAMGALQTTFVGGCHDRSAGDDDADDDSDGENHEKKQAHLADQLANLNEMLAQKEELASTMMANEEKIKQLRDTYENSLAHMQEELATLQQERDKLDKQSAAVGGGSDPKCKIAEQRRKRIMELETQMQELRKKVQEQSRAIKMSEKSEKKAKQLAGDIAQMKQNKVRLVKQMKEDAEKNRIWKQAKEKEVIRLKQTERKQQVQMAKMESMHVKQRNVMKRKMEEAVVAKKRLQELIAKQKNAKKAKGGEGGKQQLIGSMDRVKNLVNHELDVVVTVKDAIQSRENLVKDRAHISKQLEEVKAHSRRTMLSDERRELEKKRKELKGEMDARNVEIANLQRQIMDAKQESESSGSGGGEPGSGAAWYDCISSMNEAKLALQHLFEKATDMMSALNGVKSEASEFQQMFREATANVRCLEREIASLKTEKEAEVVRLTKEFEDQKCLLLSKLTNPDLAVKEGDFAKFSEFHQKLKKTMKGSGSKEKQQLSQADYDVIFESSEGEDESADDMDAYDPEWKETPLFRRIKKVKDNVKIDNSSSSTLSRTSSGTNVKRKLEEEVVEEGADAKRRSGSELCRCKRGCKTKVCSCRAAGRICGDACKCVGCENDSARGGGGGGNDDVDNCTAGTMSLLNATFDMSDGDVKENVPENATFVQPATPLSSACTGALSSFLTPGCKDKRKTIFQSPLNDTSSVSPLPRPLVSKIMYM